MQVQELSEKLANDIAAVLYKLRTGYQDHIKLCDYRINMADEMVMPDGKLPAESKQAHVGYIQELEKFTNSIGFALPVES